MGDSHLHHGAQGASGRFQTQSNHLVTVSWEVRAHRHRVGVVLKRSVTVSQHRHQHTQHIRRQ